VGAQTADLEARSADGCWILRADNETRVLLAIDASTGITARVIPVADRGGVPSRIARVFDAAPRRSFIALLTDAAETWELSYDPDAEPVYAGQVHDYRMREGLAEPGPLPVRRILLEQPLIDALFSPQFDYFVGRAAAGTLHVVSLNVRRRIETLKVDGDVMVERGRSWQHRGHALFALPDSSAPVVHVLDGKTWRWRAPLVLPAEVTQLHLEDDGSLVAGLANGATIRLTPGSH